VTNTNDSGDGSLRDALTRVNADTANTSSDLVLFHIPGPGPFTIDLQSALPALTHPVWINGDSESAFLHQKSGITIDGSAITGTTVDGLTLDSGGISHTTIQGLTIQNFSGDGINAAGGGSSVTFRNNVISTTGSVGIDISAGGSDIHFLNNQLSGNYTAGIDVSHGGSNVTFFLNRVSGTSLQTAVDISTGGSNLSFTKNNLTGAHGTSVVNLSGGGSAITFAGNILSGDTRLGLDLSGGGTNITLSHLHVSLTSDSSIANQAALELGGATGGTSATISNSDFSTGGAGMGVMLASFNAASSASFQNNDFHTNMIGVFVQGDGTSAGTIDLGGGTLGSTGGNNFRSFRTAGTGTYAIGLFNVASTYTVSAQHNLFDVSDPAAAIADQGHDTGAGGSGLINLA
jgi:hypothetical protein